LSSLSGRDWSCFKNTVSITALSAVGAAFSAGAAAVWAVAPELNAKAPASATIATHDPIPCDIAVSLLNSLWLHFRRSLRDRQNL
jgi:hypothetical protein